MIVVGAIVACAASASPSGSLPPHAATTNANEHERPKRTRTELTLADVRGFVRTINLMPLTGTYVPSTMDWVREQVDTYEATDGQEANTLRETGIPIIVVTTKGASTGNIRKFALMRVEHEGEYALVASIGGAPKNPSWYHNLVAEPMCEIQDGPVPADYTTRIVDGDDRKAWWDRAVAVFPTYAQYAEKSPFFVFPLSHP